MKLFSYIFILSITILACSDEGKIIERWETGEVKIKQFSIDRSNTWEIHYYPSGKIKEEGKKQLNWKMGEWNGWYENGIKQYQIIYREGKPFGHYTKYHPNGIVKESGTYNFDGDHDEHYTSYNENGIDIESSSFRSGVTLDKWEKIDEIHSIKYLYFPNGCIKESKTFRKSKEHGKSSRYYTCGTIQSEGNYNNGYKTEKWTNYYESGKIQSEGNYSLGEMTGKWTFYYPSGKRELEGKYLNGRKIGTWSFWLENGVLEYKIKHLENGTKIREEWEWKNDSISYRIQYKESVKITTAYKHGKKMRTTRIKTK